MTTTDRRRLQHLFVARGAALEIFNRRDGEVLIAGPAGTGKSRAAMEKLHLAALLNPGLRGLIVRKTATSLTSSALKTWERDVVAEALQDGSVWFHGGSNREPPAYRYTNGSSVAIGGLDKPIKVMSTEYDFIYAQEGTEFTEDEWEAMSSRLRSGIMSFQQLLGDCNPAHPTHWLRQRAQRGQTVMLHSRHEDNPRYFNLDGSMTVQGADYMKRLDGLTGVRRLRLRDGIWAASEGVIYDEWDEARHVIDRFDVPYDWPRFWSVDFGYVHPFVWQDWTRRPDGGLVLVREIFHTRRLVEDHCRQIKRLHTDDGSETGRWVSPRPQFITADHDAEDRATFERHIGWGTIAANKNVSEGIQAFAQRLRRDGQGRSRLEIMRDACVEKDQDLVDAKAPTCTAEEIPGYVWAPGKEQPVKEFDDGCLVAGTQVLTSAGLLPIERVRAGAQVWTRGGWRPVLAAGMTSRSAQVFTVALSNGGRLTGTGDHPVWVSGRGWVRLDALRYSDRLQGWKIPRSSSSKGLRSAAIRTRISGRTGTTSRPAAAMLYAASRTSTVRSGRLRTARSLPVTTFTTSTSIRSTATSATSSVSALTNTRYFTPRIDASPARFGPRPGWRTSTGSVRSRGSGTPPTRAGRGTASTAARSGLSVVRGPWSVSSAATSIKLGLRRGWSGSAQVPARRSGGSCPGSMTSIGSAPTAAGLSGSTGMRRPVAAPVSVLSVTAQPALVPVWNLTVDGDHEFVADGALVHNCDAGRYLVAECDLRGQTRVRWG